MNIPITLVLFSSLLVFPGTAASYWVKSRPSTTTVYDETIGNDYTDGIASVGIGVHIYRYVEGPPGNDYLQFRVSASANTRKAIQYDVLPWSYNWYYVSDPTGITGDDSGTWLDLPFPVLYYGVEYNRVWVCSNGFLSFDCPSTSPTPESIPNTNKPNSTIAVFWRDLNPAAGGSITCGYISQTPSLFVISWNNVPNKVNGVAQTFQVVIRDRQGAGSANFHNWIIFQYESITKDYPTTVGVEDQVGDKGTSYDYNNLYNGLSLKFDYGIAGYRLEQLTIKLYKYDSYAKIDIREPWIGGYNVILKEHDNPYGDFFKSAIKYAAGLLITGKAGIICKTLLIIGEAAGVLSGELSKPDLTPHDADESTNEAYLTGITRDELQLAMRPFDSTLSSEVIWDFLDANSKSHTVTIGAELVYYDLTNDLYYTIDKSVALYMKIPSGGGCPYVSVWNGTQYVIDNNVLPRAEMSNGADVEDYYRLEQNLVPKNGKHSLIISEFESEHSYIDQVKMLAVDHESDVSIAVTPDGEILTYKNPVAPLSAVDNNGTSRLGEISLMDGNLSDPATYFQGEPGDYLILNFWQVDSDNAKLILRDDQKKLEECILVQVKDCDDKWQTVEVLVPRAYWSMEAVDLAPYIVGGQDFAVRLYWKHPHRLDYVGLDTTEQEYYEIHYANLVSAVHSAQGNVKTLLTENDNTYAELVPGRQIQLEFTLPNNSEQARTYVLYTEGHYYTITS